MPITDSAKKALRSSARKQGFNEARKNEFNHIVKRFKKFIQIGQLDDAKLLFPRLQQVADKTVKTDFFKSNTASRVKSRMSIMLKKAEEAKNKKS